VYQNKGRWFDGDLIRFYEGTKRPIGGWDAIYDNAEPTPAKIAFTETTNGKPSAIITWARNDTGAAQAAIGTNLKCYQYSQGVRTDITIAGLTTGNVDGAYASGAYGVGAYGIGAYGVGDPTQSVLSEADTWSFDTWGDYLVACFTADGRLFYWDGDTGNDLAVMTNAPTTCSAVVVTPERFVVALGAGGDPRHVQWCDQEDYATWTASASNQAGDWYLAGNGRLQMGLRGRGETLLWTTQELYAMRYIGSSLVYQIQRIGTGCGVVSRHGAVAFDGRAAWMGSNSFFAYDGTVRAIPCSVSDDVFGDINVEQISKVWGLHIAAFQEIWWFYPGAGSVDCDRYVSWNYKENHWSKGALERACGYERQAYDNPMMSDGANLFMHESSTNLDSLVPYLESGPIEIGEGDRMFMARWLLPDEGTALGGPGLGNVSAYIKSRIYPTETETTSAELTLAAPTSVRVTAREIRLRIEQEAEGNWRVGDFRLEGALASRR